MSDCDCKSFEKHADIFHATLGEYARQEKGGVLLPQVKMLKGMIESKMRPPLTPAQKTEARNALLQFSAVALKMLEGL